MKDKIVSSVNSVKFTDGILDISSKLGIGSSAKNIPEGFGEHIKSCLDDEETDQDTDKAFYGDMCKDKDKCGDYGSR